MFVVLIGLAETGIMINLTGTPIQYKTDVEGGGSGISAFRSFRLIRVLRSMKMIKKWKSMNLILQAVITSGPGLLNFSTLLLLFMLVYALCGMQMFAGKLGDLRSHFDNVGMALLTVFQVWLAIPETMKSSTFDTFEHGTIFAPDAHSRVHSPTHMHTHLAKIPDYFRGELE